MVNISTLDSLTQITLGAAVGELTLGKKVGNRAMLWGAVAGTIPDLDNLVGFFFKNVFGTMDELEYLMFHRGPSHSLLFAFLCAFPLAYYTNWLYKSGTYKKSNFKNLSFGFAVFFIGFSYYLLGDILYQLFGLGAFMIGLVSTLLISGYFLKRLWKHYMTKPSYEFNTTFKEWYLLFVLAIGTHPVLDCFTVYGTQILWPFNDARVAFSNISVADPIYTLPFIICVIVASLMKRSQARFNWNLAGIIISSCYMLFTLYNQQKATKVLKSTLAAENISYSRALVTPSIFNNILWRSTVESNGDYYLGMYSFFDKEKRFKFDKVNGNHALLTNYKDDHTLNTLQFFSDDYYAVMQLDSNLYQLNDLRYGTFKGDGSKPNDYIFKFKLIPKNGELELQKTDAGPEEGDGGNFAANLWNRMLGKED